VNPRTLDHVAFWVADRDSIADAVVERLGMHVIERTDAFTLVGADARRGKLTLFAAEGPRERGALKHVAWRVPEIDGDAALELGEGVRIVLVEGEPDLDHVALYSHDPEATASEYASYGFDRADPGPSACPRVEVGGAWIEFQPGAPSTPERPLLNHLAVLVDSAAEAEDAGYDVADVVDAANTFAVFVWGPERVKLEYVEHKPEFSLT